ncbi:MAG: tetratricopeptide repeat protein [Spirochaetota bacterium]|nr:tetratricopeptide repeat protein [Spirochaetota bacterium]
MKKIVLSIIILVVTIPCTLYAIDPLENISLGLFGGYFLPAGYYADIFNPGIGFGVSAMIDTTWRNVFMDTSALVGIYSMKESSNSTMQTYVFTIGPGYVFPLTRWLKPYVSLQAGGAYMRFIFDQSSVTSSVWKPVGVGSAGVIVAPFEYVNMRIGASYSVSELSEKKLYVAQFTGSAIMRLSVFAARNIVDIKESLVRLTDIKLKPVWGARYALYQSEYIGTVKVTNYSKETLRDIRVETAIEDIASGPTKSETVYILEPGKSVELDLPLSISQKILDVTGTRELPVKLRTFYTSANGVFSYIEKKNVTVYSKNYLTWDNTAHIGSFITPQEETVSSYVRKSVSMYKQKMLPGFNKKLQEALVIFDSLGAAGITYATDPNTGYGKIDASSIDYVMFPRETLRKKAGDCDDLTVLYCALLENLGIKTAVVTVPGHIFMMFDTEVPENSSTDITADSSLVYTLNGTVWIPVEVTMVGKSFLAAWQEGAKNMKKYGGMPGKFGILEASVAWNKYPPADIGEGSSISVPSQEKIDMLYALDMDELKTKGFEEPVQLLKAQLGSANEYDALNKLGVLYAKHGIPDQAISYLQKAVSTYPDRAPAYVNLGNVYMMKKDYTKALPLYQKAVELNPNNHKYRLSLARALFETGKPYKAKDEYQQALKNNPGYARRYAYLESNPKVKAADPDERAGYNMWIVEGK